MAREIFDYFKSKRYYDTTATAADVRRVALSYGMEIDADLGECLSSETISEVLDLMKGGE